MKHGILALSAAILFSVEGLGVGGAFADSITFYSSNIPLPDCRVSAIQSGRVQYVDLNNQRQIREIREIRSISFDGFDELDEAERLLEGDDAEAGVRQLLRALRAADDDLQRLWVRYRLARVHDALGEYVQSVAHVAEVYRMTGSADWTFLEPFTDPKPSSYAAAREALANLERAKREVQSQQLRSAIDDLIDTIQPIHDEAEKLYEGPPIAAGSTLSGIAIEVIESTVNAIPDDTGDADPASTGAADDDDGDDDDGAIAGADTDVDSAQPDRMGGAGAGDDAGRGNDEQPTGVLARPEERINDRADPTGAAPLPASRLTPNSPEQVDALLRDAMYTDALTRCERIAADPGGRDLDRFLVQYGHALIGTGRTKDAAVMFTRCALLYDGTPPAVEALIETARIYRDTFNQPATARRLLERAIDRARMLELDTDAAVARELIDSLNDIDL